MFEFRIQASRNGMVDPLISPPFSPPISPPVSPPFSPLISPTLRVRAPYEIGCMERASNREKFERERHRKAVAASWEKFERRGREVGNLSLEFVIEGHLVCG